MGRTKEGICRTFEVMVKGLARISFLAPLLGILLLAAGPVTNPMLAQRGAAAGNSSSQLLELVNQERARAGLPALVWDSRLAAAAQRHAEAMAKKRKLSHQLPGEPDLQHRLAAAPLDISGENVGFGPDIAGIHDGFMHSPPHRANILDPGFDAIGIGLASNGTDYFVTEDFARLMPTVGRQTAVDEVAQAVADARAQAGRPSLRRILSPSLNPLACSMGQEERADPGAVLKLPGARHAAAYSTGDPARLPENVGKTVLAGDVDGYSVGACFVRSRQYPSGTYWVALAMLSSER
jgi:hypothetical protein